MSLNLISRRNAFTAVCAAALIPFSLSRTASAAQAQPSEALDTQAATQQISDALETFFTRYMPVIDGEFTVNESAVKSDGYGDELDRFQQMATELNTPVEGSDDEALTTQGAGSYAKCVALSALGIPASALSAGTSTAIGTAMRAYKWGLAASTIVRALGPAALKGVLKVAGGPAGIAATLAGGAIVCAVS